MVTDPPTHPQTNRQDRLQYAAPQLARSVKINDDDDDDDVVVVDDDEYKSSLRSFSAAVF